MRPAAPYIRMPQPQRQAGFTLIEALTAVAVVAVLASIAYPSYQSQMVKANRSAAQQFMLDVASREQQVLLDLRSYVAVGATANFPNAPTNASPGLSLAVPTSTSGKYTFAVTTPTATTFTVTATPVAGSSQASDGTLTLNEAGTKTPAAKW